MVRIEHVLSGFADSPPQTSGSRAIAPLAGTTLTLPFELRKRSRLLVKLDDGEEAGLFLPSRHRAARRRSACRERRPRDPRRRRGGRRLPRAAHRTMFAHAGRLSLWATGTSRSRSGQRR
jgi:hypothetical protein